MIAMAILRSALSEGRMVFATSEGMKTVDANHKIVLAQAPATVGSSATPCVVAAVLAGGITAVIVANNNDSKKTVIIDPPPVDKKPPIKKRPASPHK